MPVKNRKIQRWNEEEELQLIDLYEKYKGKDLCFNVNLVQDHELIGGRSRAAHAAKLLQEYRIKSHGAMQHRRTTTSKYLIAKSLKEGMAKDDVIEHYDVTPKLVDFVMRNIDTVLDAEQVKINQRQENHDRYNFAKPKWTVDEDMALINAIVPFLDQQKRVDWIRLPKIEEIDRPQSACKKRFLQYLKKELKYEKGMWYFRGETFNMLRPAIQPPVVEPTPVPEPAKQEPRTMTKSYLWGLFTVTKPV